MKPFGHRQNVRCLWLPWARFHAPAGCGNRGYTLLQAVSLPASADKTDSGLLERLSEARTRKIAGYWDRVSNQRKLLDKLAKELGITELSEWNKVTRAEVKRRGGAPLFKRHKSLPAALKAAYPTHPWQDEDRPRTKGYWGDKANIMKALERAEAQIGIKQPDDWYSVSLADLKEVGFPSAVTKTQLVELLAERYPAHKWEVVQLLRGKRAQQKRLEIIVARLFPDVNIFNNARKEAGLINPDTGDYLELDIFLPSLDLAFEYQERHHYTSTEYSYEAFDAHKSRDDTKSSLAAKKGITLITVPYWWDRREDSLVATVKAARPDLLKHIHTAPDVQPIPKEPPYEPWDNRFHVEDIGEPITACFLTRSSTNPTNWWMFEKYDGVRGFWNPIKGVMYSRLGNAFALPREILDTLPRDTFLDGELWFGRDNFQEAMKLGNKVATSSTDWTKFKYMVFDNPKHTGPYRERYDSLTDAFARHPSRYCEVAPKVLCTGLHHLESFFQDLIDQGGEGIILRDPAAPFTHGRCKGYLKHKKYRDAEARIVRPIGSFQWECELPNGVRFIAAPGTTEFLKRWQPQPGDIASFKHHGFMHSSQKPKLATLSRMRPDLTWDSVVANWKEKTHSPSVMPFRARTKRRPKGFWMSRENQRQFLIKFAEEMGFDPNNPENWTGVTHEDIIAKKGTGLLKRHNWSLQEALEAAFPGQVFDVAGKKQERDFTASRRPVTHNRIGWVW